MQLNVLLLSFLLSGSPSTLLRLDTSEALITVVVALLEVVVCRRSRAAQNDNPVPVPATLGKCSKSVLFQEFVRVQEFTCRFAPCHQEHVVYHERGWVEESNETVDNHGERHSIVVDSL